MSAEQDTGRFDTLKWAVVVALLAAGIVGNSYFSDQSLLYRVLGLIGVTAVGAFIAQIGRAHV